MSENVLAGTEIPGYTYGTAEVARSPLSMDDLDRIKRTVQFTEEDEHYLRMAGDVLSDQIDDVLDVWYEFMSSNPLLIHYFNRPDGTPNSEYMVAVRRRFGQWILDTCYRPFDREWLDYQYEIGLRHHRTKKNQTDRVEAPPHIGLRYVLALIGPIVTTVRPFLVTKGHGPDDVDRMHQAWFKAVVLQIALWSQPYVKEGDF